MTPPTDPTIVVRLARAGDVALMVRWAEAMAQETEDKKLDTATVTRGIEAGLADPARACYYLAERGGEPAGTLMITPEWSDWRNAWWWWIQSVYVPPEHRRHGVFGTLYRHVHALAEARSDICGLRLYVEHENVAAQRTYELLGMQDSHYRLYEAGLPWLQKVIRDF